MIKKIILLCFLIFALPAGTRADWPMAGANPQRTSWVNENLPGGIQTTWVKPIEAFVSHHVQVIGADNKVFVSTSHGLYAFDADTGTQLWVYPTDLPLGHSPTFANGVVYVGGMDRRLHAINSSTGQRLWTFTASGGFYTNPIVANGKVLIGNRDGAFYGVDIATSGQQFWKFQTGGQINISPVYKNGVVYFSSDDGFAYAVNAISGAPVWGTDGKSDTDSATVAKDQMPSREFHSWWPVIYTDPATGLDYVIFTGTLISGGRGAENSWFFTNPNGNQTLGTIVTDPAKLVAGDKTMDVSTNIFGNTIANYFETFPQQRHYYVFELTTGKEKKFDIDSDGIIDSAPISFIGDDGTTAPPIVSGFNNILYASTVVRAKGDAFAGFTVSGWKFDTPYMSLPSSAHFSSDEPHGISGAGNKIYWTHCCDRSVGAVDISRPNSTFPSTDKGREFGYIGGGGLPLYVWPTDVGGLPISPNAYYFQGAVRYFWDPQILNPAIIPDADPSMPCCAAVFWNENDKAGPAIYQGKVYVILGNALVAIGPCTDTTVCGNNARLLPMANISVPQNDNPLFSENEIRGRLEQEVAEMVRPLTPHKHYKPSKGIGDFRWDFQGIDEFFGDYWHNPADTFTILLRALPFLSASLQQDVKTYLQQEWVDYSPALYKHVGWIEGTKRDMWPYPPSVPRGFEVDFDKQTGMPPMNVYAIWKFVQAGLCTSASNCTPSTLFNYVRSNFPAQSNASESYARAFPQTLNAQLVGYMSYIELAKLSGQQSSDYAAYQNTLTQLQNLRKNTFMTFPNPQSPYLCDIECYYESLMTAWNFLYMTPELGDFMRTTVRSSENDPECALTSVMSNCKDSLATIEKYKIIAPYWSAVFNGETQGEFTFMPYQQSYSMFQALALVKKVPRTELLKYLDSPIIPVGDLYYIDNLVAVLAASTSPTPTPLPANRRQLLLNWLTSVFDQNGDNKVNSLDFTAVP
jgi:hypothetical protein